jgi:hypothetical protein
MGGGGPVRCNKVDLVADGNRVNQGKCVTSDGEFTRLVFHYVTIISLYEMLLNKISR